MKTYTKMFKRLAQQIQYAAVAAPVFAANDINLTPPDQFSKLGTFTPGSLISGAIGLVMLIVSLVFFFMLVWGGLKWIMSGGDQKAVEAARGQITNALIGLAIVFAAWAIVKLIGIVFGVDLMNIQIPTIGG